VLVFCFLSPLLSQSRIDGRIVDKTTSEPLVGVNIFFSKTTLGTTSDENGFFTLSKIPGGQYELIVSMIGYEVERESMIIKASENLTVNFRLTPQAILMNEINVTAKKDRQWDKNYGIFKRSFLGTGKNGEACRIINEYVLSFSKYETTFSAKASQPLIIENPELGYKITYILYDFVKDADEVQYSGDIFFEEEVSSSKKQSKQWNKNRQKAYKGSLRHFLNTLANRFELRFDIVDGQMKEKSNWRSISDRRRDPLVKEGFSLLINKKDLFGESIIIPEQYKPLKNDTLVFLGKIDEPLLSFEGRMMVTYLKESPEFTYLLEHDSPSSYQQTSFLLLRADSVYFDKYGRYSEPYMIERQGYFSWEGVGDQLPFDYYIEKK
tara:strand:- start:3348 stop:4487 length:1140 start_codon:yes stop_codon:yes gene_type:complete